MYSLDFFAVFPYGSSKMGMHSSMGVIRFSIMNRTGGFSEFWPEYVRAHSQRGTRLLHLLGTLAGWTLLVGAIWMRRWTWILGALVISYALAWISHFFIERNRPATFEHPLWSWLADQKMVALMLVGRMNGEVARWSDSASANETARKDRDSG